MATNEAYYELEQAVIAAIKAHNPETIIALCAAVRRDMDTDTVRQLGYRMGIVEKRAA